MHNIRGCCGSNPSESSYSIIVKHKLQYYICTYGTPEAIGYMIFELSKLSFKAHI